MNTRELAEQILLASIVTLIPPGDTKPSSTGMLPEDAIKLAMQFERAYAEGIYMCKE